MVRRVNIMSNDFNMDYSHFERSAKILEMLGNSNRLLIVSELIKMVL